MAGSVEHGIDTRSCVTNILNISVPYTEKFVFVVYLAKQVNNGLGSINGTHMIVIFDEFTLAKASM